jgi:phenylacetate-CoA ligase
MTLMIETEAPGEAEAVAATVQAVTKLRGAVACVAPGSLPQDGKLIEDRRPIG